MKGWTPLIAAARRGHTSVASLLLGVGSKMTSVDVNNCDLEGKTALSVAAKAGRKALVALLLAHGAGAGLADKAPSSRIRVASSLHYAHDDCIARLRFCCARALRMRLCGRLPLPATASRSLLPTHVRKGTRPWTARISTPSPSSSST